jgi:uncharacterized RDD family membrane protein YckC
VPSSDLAQPAPPIPTPAYVGLVTRAVAFVIDAVLILLVELIIGVSGVVIITVLHLPKEINAILAVLGGVIYIVWSISYFVGFWCVTGQTPGARVMQFRVVKAEGGLLGPRRAVVRCIGLLLAALPLFAGYLLILFDRRRRGFQDRLARTVVVRTSQLSIAAAQQARTARPKAGQADPALVD